MREARAVGGRPRILMVGRMRYPLPLPDWLGRKFDALERELDLRVVASADPSSSAADERFHLLEPSRVGPLDGVLFYLRLPFHVRRQIIEFRPEAIIAESPYTAAPALVGRALARGRKPKVVLEVHGDWRTATRLYGAPSRRLLSPLVDAVGRTAVRRADAVRALSGYTEGLVEEVRGTPPTASFEAYMDLSTFTEKPPAPLPERPTALFVGMLEAYKNIDGLAAAWRRVVRELPDALLVIVGEGSRRDVVDELTAELPQNVEHIERLLPDGVSDQMDHSTVLVLPSRSEGLGRVLVESMARGRGIVASRVGGIPDVARDDREALLVEPGDVDELAATIAKVLADRSLAERLGRAAFERYQEWHTTPAEYAARVRSLVEASLGGKVPAGGRS
jgi:glycosyltransferase involved in cell wall biosynthesis